jgi:hypothetical protein
MGAVIAWRNEAERPAASISGSSEAGGLGVQSVLSPTIAEVWRTAAAGAATHYIAVDFGARVPIRLVAIGAPRDGVLPGTGAIWSAYGSNVAIGGMDVFFSPPAALNLSRGAVGRLLPSVFLARYLTVTVIGAAGDPYLQLGRLWAGDALVTQGNISYGWQRGTLDTGSSERASLSGVRNIQRGAVARSLDFSLPRLTAAEADALDDAALAIGTTGQGFVAPFSTMEKAMFGHFTAPPAPTQPGPLRFNARIAFEEDL